MAGVGAVVALLGGVIAVRGLLAAGLPSPVVNVSAVTAMNLSAGVANNSPKIVADPKDSRFVVIANRIDAPDFGCTLQISGDGGKTWLSARPVPELPPGADKCYAPEVAFDRTGTLYYLFVGLHGNGNQPMGAFLTTSSNHGHFFSKPTKALGPLNFGVRIAFDPSIGPLGRLHMVWLEASSSPSLGGFGSGPNPVMSSFSDDGGRTFSGAVQVSDSERTRVVAPALALGPDHVVHVGYYDLGRDAIDYQGLIGPTWDQNWSVVMTTSVDGGRHFGRGVVVDGSVVPPGRVMLIFTMPPVSMVVDGSRTCVAWTDARHGDPDVLLRCSDNRGASWPGAPVRLNDDAVGDGRAQYLPQLSVSPQGRIDAVFYDRRNDPSNVLTDVGYTYSNDGGRHFAANIQLSQRSFDSRIGEQYAVPSAKGLVEFGSRLGLLSLRSGPIAVWTDTSNSSSFTTSQDLFSGTVSLPGGGFRPGSSVPVGLILFVGGLLIVSIAARRRRDSGPPDEPDSSKPVEAPTKEDATVAEGVAAEG